MFKYFSKIAFLSVISQKRGYAKPFSWNGPKFTNSVKWLPKATFKEKLKKSSQWGPPYVQVLLKNCLFCVISQKRGYAKPFSWNGPKFTNSTKWLPKATLKVKTQKIISMGPSVCSSTSQKLPFLVSYLKKRGTQNRSREAVQNSLTQQNGFLRQL